MITEPTDKLHLVTDGDSPHNIELFLGYDKTLRILQPDEDPRFIPGTLVYLPQRVHGNPGPPRDWTDSLMMASVYDIYGPSNMLEDIAPSRRQGVVQAVEALQAAVAGDDTTVEAFAASAWPGAKWRGPRWRESVSTALLDGWADPLFRGEAIGPAEIDDLRAEVRRIHRQLTPLWRRRTGRGRVLLLDTPIGENLTLHDLVSGGSEIEDLAYGARPDDPRLATVLDALAPAERAVALLWADPAVSTWTEAALLADAHDPEAFGERVRRKLKRLGVRRANRAAAAAATMGELR